MKLRSKIIIWSLFSIIAATSATFIFFQWHINQMLGGNTQHVDPNQFKSTKGLIAITNVNVWYPEELSMTPNQTILIEKDRKSTRLNSSH